MKKKVRDIPSGELCVILNNASTGVGPTLPTMLAPGFPFPEILPNAVTDRNTVTLYSLSNDSFAARNRMSQPRMEIQFENRESRNAFAFLEAFSGGASMIEFTELVANPTQTPEMTCVISPWMPYVTSDNPNTEWLLGSLSYSGGAQTLTCIPWIRHNKKQVESIIEKMAKAKPAENLRLFADIVNSADPETILEASLSLYRKSYNFGYLTIGNAILEETLPESWDTLLALSKRDIEEVISFIPTIVNCEQISEEKRVKALKSIAFNSTSTVRKELLYNLDHLGERSQAEVLSILAGDVDEAIQEQAKDKLDILGPL